MVRKLLLLVVGCMAATAFIGVTSASALVYDECDGTPYNNDFLIHDLKFDTTDSHKEFAVSGSHGSGIVCGTAIFFGSGQETYTKFIYVDLPKGTVLRHTSDGEAGTKAGDARIDLLQQVLGVPQKLYNQNITTVIAARPNPNDDPNHLVCPPDALLCTESVVAGLGTAFNWLRPHPSPSYPGQEQLVIGPTVVKELISGDYVAAPAGIVGIDYLNLCTYHEIGNATQCGDGIGGDPIGGSNGNRSNGAGGCVNGSGENGLFQFQVENYRGDVTPDANACVTWVAANSRGDWTNQRPH